MRELDERLEAVERLLKADWDATFEKIRAENAQRIAAAARVQAEQLSMEMRSALNRWYDSPASLNDLSEKNWNPRLTEAGQALAEETRTRLQTLIGTSLGGAEPAASIMTDLHAVSFRLSLAAHAAQAALSADDDAAAYREMVKRRTCQSGNRSPIGCSSARGRRSAAGFSVKD